MSSSRLPGKVLKPLPWGSETTVLQQVIRRCQAAQGVDEVIIATSDAPEDQAIVDVARSAGVPWVRGPLDNVLQRYVQATEQFALDTVVRVTSDCPCIDPAIITALLELHAAEKADYTSNGASHSFPHGLEAEVVRGSLLVMAGKQASTSFEQEHVTPWVHTTMAAQLHKAVLQAPPELTAPDIRITLDMPADYTLLCSVFAALYPDNPYFDTAAILALFARQPWLKEINRHVCQKVFNPSWEQERQEAVQVLRLQDLPRAAAALEALP
jgi:spore coat polysaccharide biosynthesis protein SpsF